MRIHPIVLLAAWLSVSSCGDPDGPSGDGMLVVQTATSGEAPDPDGYRLTVDDRDTLELTPSGSAELAVRAGGHTLKLLGVAAHCSVQPGVPLEIDVAPASRTSVAFTIECPATGVRITTVTTGVDLDPDGYLITVDGVAHTSVPANGTILLLLPPGQPVIGVAGLTPNCATAGSASHRVTIVEKEVLPLELTAVCTAVNGVIGVVVRAGGVDLDGDYVAMVDLRRLVVRIDQPTYLANLPPGDHVVSLTPPTNCSVETEPQLVSLKAGGLVRDTVAVSFAVSCRARLATLRTTVTTSGSAPAHGYRVNIGCRSFYCYYYALGTVGPTGTLVSEVAPETYDIWLDDVPNTCGITGPASFTIGPGETLDLEYSVSCP